MITDELQQLLNKCVPMMTDKGVETFERMLEKAVGDIMNQVFTRHELSSFNVKKMIEPMRRTS